MDRERLPFFREHLHDTLLLITFLIIHLSVNITISESLSKSLSLELFWNLIDFGFKAYDRKNIGCHQKKVTVKMHKILKQLLKTFT